MICFIIFTQNQFKLIFLELKGCQRTFSWSFWCIFMIIFQNFHPQVLQILLFEFSMLKRIFQNILLQTDSLWKVSTVLCIGKNVNHSIAKQTSFLEFPHSSKSMKLLKIFSSLFFFLFFAADQSWSRPTDKWRHLHEVFRSEWKISHIFSNFSCRKIWIFPATSFSREILIFSDDFSSKNQVSLTLNSI